MLTATLGLGILSPGAAFAAPASFQMPFPCNEVWYGNTYNGHDIGNRAIDWTTPRGQSTFGRTVVASASGTVVFAGGSGDGGNWVTVDHGGGWTTGYGHLSRIDVSVGTHVEGGQRLGVTGATGHVIPLGFAHLHYVQRLNGQAQPVTFGGTAFAYTYNDSGSGKTSGNCPGPPPPPPGPVGPPAGSATGSLDRLDLWTSGIIGRPTGAIAVAGWTIDPDAPSTSTQAHVYVDGSGVAILNASQSRPDVANVVPGAGPNHGFNVVVPGIAPGAHNVCVYAFNLPGTPGDSAELGCRNVTVAGTTSNDPIGSIDLVTAPAGGTVRFQGWVIDPDAATTPTDVHLYVDGVPGVAASGRPLGPAATSRPDVANVVPNAGPNHGFDYWVNNLAPGVHDVCLYAINRNGGANNPVLGCQTLLVTPSVPIGSVDVANLAFAGSDHGVRLAGWAIDPDHPAPIQVHVYVDGAGAALLTANTSRPDLASPYPYHGANHGYDAIVPLTTGTHTVCLYAIGVNASGAQDGQNPLLEDPCRQVTVGDAPFGSLDAATRPSASSITVSGWGLDPNTAGTSTVHVYVDNTFKLSTPANLSRPDVGDTYRGYGNQHGYSATVTGLSAGSHQVCTYTINQLAGSSNTLNGCLTV